MFRTSNRARGLVVGASAAVLAAGVLSSQAGGASADTDFEGPVFEDGMSQPVFDDNPDDWIRQELWVETGFDSDGDGARDRVHVSLARPAETESADVQVPVIYEDSPYYAGIGPAENWGVDHPLGDPPATRPVTPPWDARDTSPIISTGYESTWIPRGYAVVHSESPGTGLSDGCPTSGGPNESLAPKAVIDWLNGRAQAYAGQDSDETVPAPGWTTGKVGMTGTSYNGTLPEGVATTGVEGLEAIIPVSAISSWYDYYRANGAVRAPGGYQGEDTDVLADAVYSRSDREICQPVIDKLAAEQDRATGDYSRYWANRDYMRDVDNVHAATLVAHGLNDWNVMAKNAARFYRAVERNHVPHQIYLHQGGHGGAPPDDMMNRWFTRFLYGVDNGVEKAPHAYVVREGDDRGDPTAYADFPDPKADDVRLRTTPGGRTQGGLTTRSHGPGKHESLVDDASIQAQTLVDAATSEHRLAYLTKRTDEDVRISGTPTVRLRAAFSEKRANLTALLVQYNADGSATILTRGWMDPRNRRSDRSEIPLRPGRSAMLRFDLQPKDSVIPAGSRVGLVVMSSDNEFTIRPPAGTKLTLDTRSSRLNLPVVGGNHAWRNALR
ncbi:Xaa-Pro dipeptidyl-peptidase [Solicola gregarius]|uniref:Xaa-Pro dipeptidyl-peptidase n=1 Tax=Solicola gregarius TaxID=2908642 RepID=A0AA46TM07_9ACTN|nr:Xaa-Pro dipeptidyl-peptidase [Solicola gregarius]UYM07397.1 Xaa-Pro dipeptidyl-peptidase [Solicola gregarius]